MPFVPIIMGSRSDAAHGEKVKAALAQFGISSELRAGSAHKVPAYLIEMLNAYESRDDVVGYVAIAGRSNALAGVVDGAVTRPVVTVPPYSDRYGGADLFSSIRMPSGIAPALILDPDGAALFIAKFTAIGDDDVRRRVRDAQQRFRERVMEDDSALTATDAG